MSSDLSAARDRARDRERRVLLTAAGSAIAKLVTISTALISVPLLLSYLGAERYGLWMTISSLTLLLGFVDLGLGNGLLNGISEAYAREDTKAAREYISSAVLLSIIVALTLSVILLILKSFLPWGRIFNVSAPVIDEAGNAASVFLVCLFWNVPISLVQRVQAGYQRGFDNSIWQAVGSFLGLLGLLVAIKARLNLPWLVLTITGLPLLATASQGIVLFRTNPDLTPHWRLMTRGTGERIMRLGLLFLILQLSMAIAFASDNIVAAHVLGPESVAAYSVTARLFSVPISILAMILMPLWPAYGEAVTRGDTEWVKRTLSRSLLVALAISGVPSLLLLVSGIPLIHWWAGSSVTPSTELLVGLALWTVLQALGSATAMFLNGANIVRFQVICAVLLSIGAFVSKILFARTWGLAGIAWATTLSYAAFIGLPYVFVVPRLLSSLPSRTSRPI